MLFFCLTLLAAVVDERRTVDPFSHFCHIVDVLVLVVFLVFASVFEVLQSISCLPCAPQTSLASRDTFAQASSLGLRPAIAHIRIGS